MPRRRDGAEQQGAPPPHLLSLPVWITEGRSPDPALARSDWEQARSEWGRGAPSLDALNRLYGAGLDAGPQPDPRAPGHEREKREDTMTEAQHKTFTPVGLKVAGGHVEAVFSVFGNIDNDSDIVMAGAVADGAEIIVSAWNHASWQPGILPLGRGVIRTNDAEATVSADFFNTSAANDTLEVLQGLGGLCQWSFGFRVLDSELVTLGGKRVQLLHSLDVSEASPVLLAANPLTRTLTVSGDESADEQLAREYARYAAGELDRQMAAELADIRAGL